MLFEIIDNEIKPTPYGLSVLESEGLSFDEFVEKINNNSLPARFPSHLIIDGSDPVEAEFARAGVSKSSGGQSGVMKSGVTYSSQWNGNGNTKGCGLGDTGTPSRFFYCAKPSSRERNEGLGDMRNIHPTLKSISLMSYLITMLTPKGGTVLDCFMGSGTTIVAAIKGGFKGIGIEQHRPYFEIAEARIRHANLGQQGEIIASEPLPVKPKVKLQMEMF